jgi:molybdopterin-guanine dinucleotide biosynthesis protein B
MHELRGADEPPLDYLLSRLQHCDLVLVEGFKSGDFPKLEVWRAEIGKPTLWPDWPGILAIAGDSPAAADGSRAAPPCLPLHDTAAIAGFVLDKAQTYAGAPRPT